MLTGSKTRTFSHLGIKPGTKLRLMLPDMPENRQSQGSGGGEDEDQILGELTVPTTCSKYQATEAMPGQDFSSPASASGRCPVPREPKEAQLPGNTGGFHPFSNQPN